MFRGESELGDRRLRSTIAGVLTSTSDAKIRRRIYDLALYTRYVELFFNYSTASGAARQTAFEALMRYTYRIRSTLMVHSYALWRDLDARDAAVTLPDPNTGNNTAAWAENPHPWKSEQAYTDAEIDDFIENGIVNNPLLTWTPVSFSENLVPATSLGLTSGPAGSWTYLRYKNSIHMWAPSTPTTFNLNVKGGYIYTNVGNVTLALTAANNPIVGEVVASASAQPSQTTTAVSMNSQFQGLHTIEIQDNAGGSSVWPTTTGIPFTFGLGIENCTQFQSRWTLYFYVPKGTTKVGGYSWGGRSGRDGQVARQHRRHAAHVHRHARVFPSGRSRRTRWQAVEVPDGQRPAGSNDGPAVRSQERRGTVVAPRSGRCRQALAVTGTAGWPGSRWERRRLGRGVQHPWQLRACHVPAFAGGPTSSSLPPKR